MSVLSDLLSRRVSLETGLLNKITLSGLPGADFGSSLVGRLTCGFHRDLFAFPSANTSLDIALLLQSLVLGQLLAVVGNILCGVVLELGFRVGPRRTLDVWEKAVIAVPTAKAVAGAVPRSLLEVFVLRVRALAAVDLSLPLLMTRASAGVSGYFHKINIELSMSASCDFAAV